MRVNNHNQQGKDYRSQPRWSAGKKADAVLRLPRGEPLEELSRERKVEAHRLAAWRDGVEALWILTRVRLSGSQPGSRAADDLPGDGR